MVDRFLGLRLDAVVSRDHDHGDVGTLGAARSHRCERLVARRVEERHGLIAVMHLIGANVLRDAARLAGRHLGLTDCVEQRGLPVVYVSHDRDHRRTLDEVLVGVMEHGLGDGLILGVDDVDCFPELPGELDDCLVGERLGQRLHLPQRHQLLDDLR